MPNTSFAELHRLMQDVAALNVIFQILRTYEILKKKGETTVTKQRVSVEIVKSEGVWKISI